MEIGSPLSASKVRESPMSCSSVISCGLEPAAIGSTASFRLGGPRRNSLGMGSFTTAYLFDNDFLGSGYEQPVYILFCVLACKIARIIQKLCTLVHAWASCARRCLKTVRPGANSATAPEANRRA